jgi:hypothetical protein
VEERIREMKTSQTESKRAMERELESKTQEIEARLLEENKKVTQAVTKIKDEEILALESKMKDMKAQIDQIFLERTNYNPYF